MRTITPSICSLVVVLAILLGCSQLSSNSSDRTVTAQPAGADAAFNAVWERSDGLVANGRVDRTWMWGPPDRAVDAMEPYRESPDGQRAVRYFDKSRMELTHPDANPDDQWFVTNGLLVRDLVSGQRQVGDSEFEQRDPSGLPIAGDVDDPDVPTYSTLRVLLDIEPRADGAAVVEQISRAGEISEIPALADYGVTSAYRITAPGIDHQVASVFWEFMNSSGLVIEAGRESNGPLFPSPFYATGLPLTEAYWVRARVGGQDRDVLFQAFERRVLTYTPDNPAGWQVESGNVGLHYYDWLYGSAPEPTPTPTASPEPAPGATATATEPSGSEPGLVTVGPGAVDAWMRSIVRDSHDRVWIAAIDNNAPRQGEGPGRLVIYRATAPGIPLAFELVEAGVVTSASAGGEIVFADAALDGEERLHVAWLDRGAPGQPLLYGIFDLASERRVGAAETVDETGLAGFGGNPGQGGVSLALGADGAARVAYAAIDNHTQIRVRVRTGAGWGPVAEPLRVEGAYVWHPALALGPDGVWYLAAYDATNNRIIASHDAGQGWTQSLTVAGSVLGPENIDQSPALLVTPEGSAVLVYLDAGSHIRVSAFVDDSWRDLPLAGDYFTHAPGLGVFADGDLVIAGHDEFHPTTAMNAIVGSSEGWSGWESLVRLQADGSAVFRWAGAYSSVGLEHADLVFFDEDLNDDGVFDDQMLYYVAVARPG